MSKGEQTFRGLDFERCHCKNIDRSNLALNSIHNHYASFKKAAALFLHKKKKKKLSWECLFEWENSKETFHKSRLSSQAVMHDSIWFRSLSIFSTYDNKYQKLVCLRSEGGLNYFLVKAGVKLLPVWRH